MKLRCCRHPAAAGREGTEVGAWARGGPGTGRRSAGRRRANGAAAALALLALVSGCAARRSGPQAVTAPEEALAARTAAELRAALSRFEGFYTETVESAMAQVELRAATRAERRAAVEWKIWAVERCRAALAQDNALAALVDVWGLCARLVPCLETGEGSEMFGPEQDRVVEAARSLLARITATAEAILPAADFAELSARIDRFARDHPLVRASGPQPSGPATVTQTASEVLTGMVKVPLSPLLALDKFNQGADSFRDLTQETRRFTDVVEDLPASARWQLQLLSMHLEETETVQTLTRSAQELSASAVRFAAAAEELPQRLRAELRDLLPELEAAQPELRATLREARETSAELRAGLGEARQVTESAAEAGRAWEQTAAAVQGVLREIAALREPAGPKPAPGHPAARPAAPESPADGGAPFDINEYTAAADAFATSAREVRALLAELGALLDGGPGGRHWQVVDARIGHVVDRIARRAGQLLLLAFALLVAWRLLNVALGRAGRRVAARAGPGGV